MCDSGTIWGVGGGGGDIWPTFKTWPMTLILLFLNMTTDIAILRHNHWPYYFQTWLTDLLTYELLAYYHPSEPSLCDTMARDLDPFFKPRPISSHDSYLHSLWAHAGLPVSPYLKHVWECHRWQQVIYKRSSDWLISICIFKWGPDWLISICVHDWSVFALYDSHRLKGSDYFLMRPDRCIWIYKSS